MLKEGAEERKWTKTSEIVQKSLTLWPEIYSPLWTKCFHSDSVEHPLHTKEGAHKGRWWNFHVFGAFSLGLNFNIFWNFLPIFCCSVSCCVYDHSNPYLVSECLFLAENKAFQYSQRVRAHPRRVRAILWDAAATCSVVIFMVVAAKKRSPNLSVSWLTLYGLVDQLPVSAGNFRRTLQSHFLVDFQTLTENIAGKIFSCSKRACFAFVNRARSGWTAFARSLPTHRFRDGSKTEAASVRGTAASFVNRFSKPR